MHTNTDILTLLRHLYVVMTKSGVVAPTAPTEGAQVFHDWFRSRLNTCSGVALCEQAGVPVSTWDHLVEALVDSSAALTILATSWYAIVLATRPAPTHQLASLTWSLVLQWEDGHVFPLMIHADVNSLPQDRISDADVAGVLASQYHQFLRCVLESGLDQLYATSNDLGPNTAATFGTIIDRLFDLAKTHPELGNTVLPMLRDPVLLTRLRMYTGICQALLRPVTPPEARRSDAGDAPPSVTDRCPGGWDSP